MGEIPNKFGVRTPTVQRRFWSWTDADVWRQLAAAALGTPHEQWAQINAAISRAGPRARGYPHAELSTEPAAKPAAAIRRRTDKYAVSAKGTGPGRGR